MPDRESYWCNQITRINPTWDHRVFGNEILNEYGQDPYVKALISRGEAWAFVMDRIRALLLAKHGGIWLDPDCQPARPLDTRKDLWDDKDVEFVMGLRSPHRPLVALHRGVTLCDNTIMASAPNSRMIRRILSLWTPNHVRVDGHATGVEMIANLDGVRERLIGYRYFYDLQDNPDAIVLHDHSNLGSWVEQEKAKRMTLKTA